MDALVFIRDLVVFAFLMPAVIGYIVVDWAVLRVSVLFNRVCCWSIWGFAKDCVLGIVARITSVPARVLNFFVERVWNDRIRRLFWVKEFRDFDHDFDAAMKVEYWTRFYFSRVELFVEDLLKQYTPGFDYRKESATFGEGINKTEWRRGGAPWPSLIICTVGYVGEERGGRGCFSCTPCFEVTLRDRSACGAGRPPELWGLHAYVDCRKPDPLNWLARRRIRRVVELFARIG